MAPIWQPQAPIPAIVFDCDGTLSMIEGIDELAKHNGVSEAVQALTAEAMEKTGLHPDLYRQRL
ncbi:MAG: phosphoserine phosphatase, partial [Gammaproteobacteria bacterium]